MADLAVGAIGAGVMGSRHATNLHNLVPGARVAAISDPDLGRAAQLAAACGSARVFSEAFAYTDPHARNEHES